MRNVVRIACLMAVIGITPAHALDYIKVSVPEAQPVGKGRMSVMFWDVYDAVLYAPGGAWREDKPFALSLTYLRDLEGRAIADRSAEEIRKLGFADEVRLAAWHSQMRRIFPDVTEGTTLTGIYTAKGESVFYRHGEETGRITDPEFGRYFFNIWLDPRTSAPELRAQLLGSR